MSNETKLGLAIAGQVSNAYSRDMNSMFGQRFNEADRAALMALSLLANALIEVGEQNNQGAVQSE